MERPEEDDTQEVFGPGDCSHMRAWAVLHEGVRPLVRRMARLRGLDEQTGDEAVQEAFLRLIEGLRGRMVVAAPRRWLLRVALRCLQDVLRGRPTCIGPPVESATLSPGSSSFEHLHDDRMVGPHDAAQFEELWARAPQLLERLPPPYREVALLQYIRGWSREEITRWLCSWRPISESTCPGILRRTHEMLPYLVGDLGPKERWPQRYNASKNPWILPPPPPISRLSD